MATTLHIMTFEQWQKRNPDIVDEVEDCDECNGTGTHECDCGNEHECGFCDGKGKVGGTTAREMYEKQLAKDQKRLSRWIEKVTA